MKSHEYARLLLALPDVELVSSNDGEEPAPPEVEMIPDYDDQPNSFFQTFANMTKAKKKECRQQFALNGPKKAVIFIG